MTAQLQFIYIFCFAASNEIYYALITLKLWNFYSNS